MEIKGYEIGKGKPLICVPVMETEKEQIIEKIKRLSESEAEMIEWRIDAFTHWQDYNAIREVFESTKEWLEKKIFLATFRSKRQGGVSEITPEQRDDIQDLIVEAGCVDLIDVEFFEETHPAMKIKKLQKKGIKVVASHHDFDETPEREVMKMIVEKMCVGNADIVKLAVMPHNMEDVLSLLSVTGQFAEENDDTPIITMSMGTLGMVSRICGESFGSAVTFAADQGGSAPGQLALNDMTEILDRLHRYYK